MKVADDQLFKRENCTKREELNALRSVIPSMRLDTGKESNPAETFPKHEDSREEGTSVVTLIFPRNSDKNLVKTSCLSLN